MQQVLINGQWRDASSSSSFQADNPASCETLPDEYPVSDWNDCDAALSAADSAATILASFPPSRIADFLDRYAENIEQHAESIPDLGADLQEQVVDMLSTGHARIDDEVGVSLALGHPLARPQSKSNSTSNTRLFIGRSFVVQGIAILSAGEMIDKNG